MRWIIIIISICCYQVVFGQSVTFNKRIQLGCNNTVLTGLEVTDSCFYVTGIAADSVTCTKGVLFCKYDTLGNNLITNILWSSTGTYGTWHPSLHSYIDDNLVVSSHYTNSNNNLLGGLLKYDTNGSVIFISMHDNPYVAGGGVRPDDLQITSDSGFIIPSSINDLQGVSDIGLLRLDKYGTEQWHITRGSPNYVDHTPCVYVNDDGTFIIGFQQDNLSGVQMNYTVRSVLEAIDSAGNTLWTYQTPDSIQVHGVNDFTKTKDNGWAVATAWGTEKLSANGTFSNYLHDAYIYKLDDNRNLVWDYLFDDGHDDRVAFNRIIELEDSSLVAFGNLSTWFPNLSGYVNQGRIVKLSATGDSLWSRQYEYIGYANAKHPIYDAECTPDGGFLICGEANGYSPNSSIFQQGWLLKLDEYGCLVPNCHIIPNSTNPIEKPTVDILLYPNPALDYLNIHYRNPRLGNELTFQVTDISGRVLNSYTTSDISDKTYIVPVYDLIKGIYIIEVLQDKEIVYVEQFVKT